MRDLKTTAEVVISEFHGLLHNRLVFHTDELAASIAIAGHFYVLLETPANVEVHLKSITHYAPAVSWDYSLIEAPTVGDKGTQAVLSGNRNRIDGANSLTLLSTDPATISGGTIIEAREFGNTVGTTTYEAVASLGAEWVLKKGALYILDHLNNTGALAGCRVSIDLYEL